MMDTFIAEPRWATVLGLFIDIGGVLLIAVGVWVPKGKLINQEIKSSTGFFGSPSSETVQGRAAFKDRFRQSRTAFWGAVLLVVGFVLQVYGGWPR